jgi:hypothetical protein
MMGHNLWGRAEMARMAYSAAPFVFPLLVKLCDLCSARIGQDASRHH